MVALFAGASILNMIDGMRIVILTMRKKDVSISHAHQKGANLRELLQILDRPRTSRFLT